MRSGEIFSRFSMSLSVRSPQPASRHLALLLPYLSLFERPPGDNLKCGSSLVSVESSEIAAHDYEWLA